MTVKVISALLIFTVLLGAAATLQAQRGEFRGGTRPQMPPQPQPQLPVRPQSPVLVPAPPVSRFFAAPVQPFGYFGTTPLIAPPIITTTYPPFYSNFAGGGIVYPSGFYGSGAGSVAVPVPTVITHPAVIVQQPFPQMVVPGQIGIPAVNPVPPLETPPSLIGASRAQVLAQFGSPAASIVTQRTETLYFTGGVSIFLQDGKVATPQRPY